MKEISMKKSIKGLYLTSLLALGALAVVLRTIALFTGFDFATGYFTEKLINNISITVVVTAVVLFATFLIYKKEYKPRVSIGQPTDYVSSGCVGVALIIVAFEIAFSNAGATTPAIGSIVTALSAILAAVASIYFASSILFGKGAPRISAAFSIALMLYLALYALMLYFNVKSPINAPAKLCDQMAYVTLAIFFAYQTRISLDRPMWRMYVISGLTATLLSAYSAIPSLIVYLARGEVISHTVSETILTLSLFLFVLSRTLSALTAEEDKASPVVELVKKMHEERAKEIEEARVSRARYNNKEENVTEESNNYEIEIPTIIENDSTERTTTE